MTRLLEPVTYPFSEQDARCAFEEWGCNCGPTALAFALRCNLHKVRPLFPDFAKRRYVSVVMMRRALETAGQKFDRIKPSQDTMFDERETRGRFSLVRIQWTGPWTKDNANPRWACMHTHWITTWSERGVACLFDCNGGIQGPGQWENEIVPIITEGIQRADGGWFPTHVWRLAR